jgi:hypothetical protein
MAAVIQRSNRPQKDVSWKSRIRKPATTAKAASVTINGKSSVDWPILEGFEDNFPPDGWTTKDLAGTDESWQQSTWDYYNGNYSAFIDYDCSEVAEDWLITPQITIKNNDSIYFWMICYDYSYVDDTYLKISTTDNQPSSFTTTLLHLWDDGSSTGNYPTDWTQYAVDLSAYAGQQIYLAFQHTDDCGDGIFIDDVMVGHEYIPVDHNMTLTSIDTPAVETVEPGIAFHPSISIKNRGVYSESGFWVYYQIDDGLKAITYADSVYISEADSVFADSIRQVVFPATFTPDSLTNYTAQAWVILPGDMLNSDDTLALSFQTHDRDVGITSINSPPNGYFIDQVLYPEAQVQNYSASEALDFWAVLQVTNSLDQLVHSDSVEVLGLSASTDSAIVFNTINPPHTAGVYTYTITLNMPLDINTSNNILSKTSSCLANKILVYEDIPDSTFYVTALNNLGLFPTLTTSWDDFANNLNGTPWDLVIVNSYNNQADIEYLDSIDSYQAKGGLLILYHWDVYTDSTHQLWTDMGISYDNTDNPDNFFPDTSYIDHQIYRYPNSIDSLIWTDDQWGTEIQLVDTLPGAKKLAYFPNWSDPYNAALVLNSAGNCIFNAFESDNYHGDHDGDGKLDIVELLENEIIWILPPHITYSSPDSGASGLPIDQQIVIGFNEPIDTATFGIVCSPDPGNWQATWNAILDTVYLTHNDFGYNTEYSVTISAKDFSGKNLKAESIPNPFTFNTGAMGVTGGTDKPGVKFFLAGARPNPIRNGNATISFGLPKESNVKLEIFNITGQKITTLASGKMNAGIHNVTWNGCNSNGNKVSSGVFIYRLTTDSGNATNKMVVIK